MGSARLSRKDTSLYGTTRKGGTVSCGYQAYCGTVFSLTLNTEKVLHTFGGSDGAYPVASLVELDGKLYGTTTSGGVYDDGMVFSVTPGGKETVLHNFGNTADGSLPDAGLIDVNGTLYGTTESGGAQGNRDRCGAREAASRFQPTS